MCLLVVFVLVTIDSNPVCRGIRATPSGMIVLDSILPDLIAAVELAGHVILGTEICSND